MSTYAVKLDDDEFVGIFCVEKLSELPYLIDECTDPGRCFYKRVESGGLYWPDRIGKPSPDSSYFEQSTISGTWWEVIMDAIETPKEVSGWKPVSAIIGSIEPKQESADAKLAKVREALKEARKTIKTWCGMGIREDEREADWQRYQASPEMQKINAAISEIERAE